MSFLTLGGIKFFEAKAMGCFYSVLYGDGDDGRTWALAMNSCLKYFYSSASLKLHLNDLKDSSRLVVIDFFLNWGCGGPFNFGDAVVRKMAAREFPDVEFIKIHICTPDVAKEFQLQPIRTFVLLKKGKEVDRVVGTRVVELRNKIEKHRALQA